MGTVLAAASQGRIEPHALTDALRISQAELAQTLGLSRESVSKRSRVESPGVQRRLREITEILNRVLPWAGSELAAYAWYRSQPLPSFGDMTAEELVRQDRANEVRTYLSRIAVGGFA